jgi:hypothetical protein
MMLMPTMLTPFVRVYDIILCTLSLLESQKERAKDKSKRLKAPLVELWAHYGSPDKGYNDPENKSGERIYSD